MGPSESHFKSKVDSWVGPAAIGTVVVSFLPIFALTKDLWLVVAIGTAASLLLTFFAVWPVEYSIVGGELKIRIGFIRQTFPIASIEHVGSPRKELASARLAGLKASYSTDRLIIKTLRNGKEWLIAVSPQDKHGFLDALHLADNRLVFEGDELRRI